MGRRKDRIEKEDYSSDSGVSDDDEDERLERYAEFESFTQSSRRKRRRHGRSKEDAMLGVFADGSSDDDRDLMRKNIRYKEVNFVEKEEDDEDDAEVTSFRPFNQPKSPESTFAQHTTTQSDTMHTTLPSGPKRSLLSSRKGTSTPTSRKYGLGASMLEKMGYKQGQGLGSEGQ